MKKFYIIRSDGSSIFEQAYSEDFIFHCLVHLLDRSSEPLKLLSFGEAAYFASVRLDSAIAAVERNSFSELEST